MTIPTQIVRIAAVSDIHYGPNDETKQCARALELLESVLDGLRDYQPSLLVDFGDRIVDQDARTDRRRAAEVAALFKRAGLPRAHLLGNHDLENLSPACNEAVLQTELSHRIVNLGGWQLILWQGDVRSKRGNLVLPDQDLDWLQNQLALARYPAVVLTHIPLDSGSTIGNYYFEDRPQGRAEYRNTADARAMITSSDAVVMVMSGHLHCNRLSTIDGVHFVTLQSLVESYTTHPEPAATWTAVELGPSIKIDVHGNDRVKYELTPRRYGFHALRRSPLPHAKRHKTGTGGSRRPAVD